jgi:hypothetical protein
MAPDQGCQIFLGAAYQNGKKYNQNGKKYNQNITKYTI